MKKLFKKSFQVRGFTLLEVIISISIITIGILGTFSLISRLNSNTSLLKGKLIATQLAQEGIEVVRNIRDRNWMEGKDWRLGLADGDYVPIFSGPTNTPADPWQLVPKNNNEKVYFNNTYKFYGQVVSGTGWQETNFSRWISLKYYIDERKLEVVSTIQWSEKGNTQTYEIKDYLYDWQVRAGSCPPGYELCEKCGNTTGTSFYKGGGDDACTGQEMVPGKNPFRDSAQNVCISNNTANLEYCSQRSQSSAICDVVSCTTGDFYKVTDPY